MPHEPEFIHRFDPGDDPGRPVLLVLHGTGGNESALLPLARTIDRHAATLSPRGKVLEQGMPRFFRRLAEGVFDQEDLRLRTRELAEFVASSAARYAFDPSRVVAVGYSNGANIAASLLLSGLDTLQGAILLRPMVPFEPESVPSLDGRQILVSASREDLIVPPALTERLVELLEIGGATVTTRWYPGGHGLSPQEIKEAAAWYRERFGC
jgi:phospholipase/carboxylesterase/glyoxalase family protein